ncbi:M13 family metallopeptidase [Chitinophaga ginsengisegetis]|uniref:M13 family metallopeptidase n=1 Tax=Chitinophaga ginsengisegetis TaxID=393003 RepID=UPI000DBAC4B0|nr:M13 family metallopeptidase [Chitinophaga ginsengisegetis]MDR6566011.1 putative endopeptidase [Chitinophaga ginsengisegetis]MDR6645740.1 putative endopeptidase [Chitinophaga ginsengisegetis]MDR6651668.1 putative endopeptidase [Chitinophaga ginsengisegetis]
MIKSILTGTGLAAITCFTACNQGQKQPDANASSTPDAVAANVDSTVNPTQDFFDYANGGWIKRNPIPAEYSSWGIGNLVQEELYKRLRIINEKAVENPTDPISKKIAAFWTSGMDSVRINQDGIKPIEADLKAIDAITTIPQLVQVASKLNITTGAFCSLYIGQDAKNSDVIAVQLAQGGLGLPNRDYYFNTDARTTNIRNAYPGHVAKMLQFVGYDSTAAKKAAAGIVQLETSLAKNSRKLEALRDPEANYHKMAVTQLNKIAGNIDWNEFIKQQGINKFADTIIVGQPEFYSNLSNAVKSQPLQTWKDYLKWNLINSASQHLSDTIANTDFAFYGTLLKGQDKQKPRWKRVLDAEESAMGEALGQLFVKEFFNTTAKKRYENLVEEIRTELKIRIEHLDWMSDSTKQKALYKLSKITKKVGYPDKWKDFTAMDIKEQSYHQNIEAAHQWWQNYQINKLGKPVDRNEWDMTPQTYNAYYNPSNNEIVLPAGIFTVPGKRDEELDDAIVYGYAGASTIGHEITHGFDDEGRQFDAAGNLKSWWTKDDERKFNERAAVMVKQFNNYVVVDTLRINGKATLGENIADLGGILLGWEAFKKTDQYKKNEKIAGYTPSQRYFMGYSLGWLGHTKKESLARQVLTDVHSPAKFRVNGPFSDVDAFYEVYGVKPGDGMYRPDSTRVRIW